MHRVLMATGIESIDESVAAELSRHGVEAAGDCYYLDGCLAMASQRNADIVVISPLLRGERDFLEVVERLRLQDVRVVLLPGGRESAEARSMVERAAALGVYDVVYDPIVPGDVVRRILQPGTLADVKNALAGGSRGEKRGWSVLGMFKKGKSEAEENKPGKKEDVLPVEPVKTLSVSPKRRISLCLMGGAYMCADMAAQRGWIIQKNPAVADAVIADLEYLYAQRQGARNGSVVVAIGEMTPGAWAAAARLNAVLKPDAAAALTVLEKMFAGIETTPSHGVKKGAIIAFYSATKGDQGKTTLAANTAFALSRECKTVAIDLDNVNLGLSWLTKTGVMDSGKLSLVHAADVENLDAGKVRDFILGHAAENEYVVLDFGSALLSEFTAEALRTADKIFMVVKPGWNAVNAVSMYRGCRASFLAEKEMSLVVNCIHPKNEVTQKDVSRIMNLDVAAAIPDDPALLKKSRKESQKRNAYVPPVLWRKAAFAKAVNSFTEKLKKEVIDPTPKGGGLPRNNSRHILASSEKPPSGAAL